MVRESRSTSMKFSAISSRFWSRLPSVAAGTAIYADGALVKSSKLRFSSQELTGQIVIGNAPATTYNWSGQLKGLAIYDRELTADEVSQHYENWTKDKQATSLGVRVLLRFIFSMKGKEMLSTTRSIRRPIFSFPNASSSYIAVS